MNGSCKQEEGESVENFITRLREKANTCEYGTLKDELIRDKIVLGVANDDIRRRLLREKGLTLPGAIEMCRAFEVTDLRMRAMESEIPRVVDAVNAVGRQPFRPNQSRQNNPPRLPTESTACRYCGNAHVRGREHCPAYRKQCKACGINNHFAKVCLKDKRRSEGKLHCLENVNTEQNSDNDDIYMHETIGAVHTKGKK